MEPRNINTRQPILFFKKLSREAIANAAPMVFNAPRVEAVGDTLQRETGDENPTRDLS